MAFVNLPPNFQDMFGALNDRIAKLETGPNQAMYTAVAANVVAVQALNEASQALAQATQSYNTASQALIKDSNTITNASNQLTGINGNGITVYSGALSNYGARVVLNSAGLAGFSAASTGPSNGQTFSISASTGAVSTTGAIFTNSTIYGGELNINGNAIINTSGYLTATGATITGTITATSGSFAGTITSTSGSIGGFTLGTNFLSGGGTTLSAATGQISAGGLITANSGVSASSLAMSGNISMGSNNINNFGTASGSSITTTSTSSLAGASFSSTVNLQAQTNYTGISTGSGSTMVLVTTGSRVAYTTSSERFKEQVQYLNPSGWLDKVAELQPITYVTASDFTVEGEPNPTQLGFLAEDLADLNNEIGYAVNNDPLGDPFSISYERLVAPLVLAVKELKARVEELESKVQ